MIQRLIAAMAASLLFSTGAFAGDLQRMARDLERVLGKGAVQITGRNGATRSSSDLVDAMNRERAVHGLAPLRINHSLSLAAQDRIADMFEQRYFAHVAPDGTQPWVWATRRGYRYRTIGENLAVGYPSAERVVRGWMTSPGHRANILQRSFDEVGIAIADEAPLRGYGGPTVVAIYASR